MTVNSDFFLISVTNCIIFLRVVPFFNERWEEAWIVGPSASGSEKGTPISRMLSLKVEDEELIRRLLSRGKDSGRADDQNESIIANRINEYNNKTAPLKEYYSAQNKLSEIEGKGTVEDIAETLNDVIDTL